MDFELTKEHLMIKDSAAHFLKKEHSFERLRELKGDSLGFSKKIWKKMADLGWMELIFPEEYGGYGYDLSFAMVLLEEFGKVLLPEPWLSTALLGGKLVLLGGTEVQKKEIIPAICSGDLLMTIAYLEDGGRYDVNFCETTAKGNGSGFSISGKKIFVMDGGIVDKFIISARTSGAVADNNGITLFLISKNTPGLKITPVKTMDGGNACILEMNDVSVADTDIIGEMDSGYPLLSEVVDESTAVLCAEMVGGMEAVISQTVWHISNRIQFGRPIGSFQALQHKAADMFIQKELAMSSVYFAVASIVGGSDEKSSAVSIAKAKCSSAYIMIAKIAVQMFGAYGFTNEADIGFYLRRAKVAEILFGDAGHHIKRYAALNKY